jgi:hypothetical protein
MRHMTGTNQGDRSSVSKQNPKLDKSQSTNPSYREQANPFDTDSHTETETSHNQPEPPAKLESLFWPLFMLIRKGCEGKRREGRGRHQRRVEKNQSGLCEETVFYAPNQQSVRPSLRNGLTKDDQASSHGCRHGAAPSSFQGKKHEGGEKNATNCGKHAHGDVWNTGFEVVLADLLEIKLSIETSEPTSEGNEHLGKGRVNVHEETTLYVLRSKSTETKELIVSYLLFETGGCLETYWTSSKTTLDGW